MDKKDLFYWNDEKNRIDGFIPLDEEDAQQRGAARHVPDPEQAYQAYLDDAYREYRDDAYGSPSYGSAYDDVREAWAEEEDMAAKREMQGKVITVIIIFLIVILSKLRLVLPELIIEHLFLCSVIGFERSRYFDFFL